MDEHQNILKVLSRVETLTQLPLEDNIEEFQMIFGFIQDYSDGYHHMKEENIYFEWIGKHSPGLKDGPVSCMLSEHITFRDLTSNAKNAFMSFMKTKEDDAKTSMFESLKMFVNLLRSHIEKEDVMLYQMAERLDSQVKCGDEEMLPKYNEVEKVFAERVIKYNEYCNGLTVSA